MFKNLIAKLTSNKGQAEVAPVVNDEPKASDAEPEKITIKVNGEDQEVTQEELVELAQKGQDYTNKTMALSEDRKVVKEREIQLDSIEQQYNEVQSDPKLKESVTKIIEDYRAGKINTPKKLDKTSKRLDQLIEGATGETAEAVAFQREQLRDMRQIIKEESLGGVSKEELDALNARLDKFEASANIGVNSQIDAQMVIAREKYGDELIDEFEKDIRAAAITNPGYLSNNRFNKIPLAIIPDNKIEDALLKSAQKRKEVEQKQKADGTFPGGESSPKKAELPRTKAGRVDTDKMLDQMKSEGAFKI